MTTNRKIVQLSLISIGFLLILVTYFLYPKINENKLFKENILENSIVETDDNITEDDVSDGRSIFENIEYKGLYNINKPFTVKSKRAYVLEEETDVVYMTSMHVTLDMKDGRIIIITSDKGTYNKKTYDCFFENNVKITDSKTIVLAENLDLLATEDSASIYNNVILTSEKGSLRADKIDYDFETKYYQVSMFNDKKVKIKLIKWVALKNLGL